MVEVDNPPWGDHRSLEAVTKGVILLDDFASAFNCDLPPSVRLQTKLLGLKFEYLYFGSKREGALRNLNQVLKTSFFCDFKLYLIFAFQDMEQQFLEIRESRKALYKFDKTPQIRMWYWLARGFDWRENQIRRQWARHHYLQQTVVTCHV